MRLFIYIFSLATVFFSTAVFAEWAEVNAAKKRRERQGLVCRVDDYGHGNRGTCVKVVECKDPSNPERWTEDSIIRSCRF
jgi:hypothetical protein